MARYRFVILGGGMVAGYAARELAELGVAPREVAIVSAEPYLPYERPPLSKGFLAGGKRDDQILINDEDFYTRHGMRVYLRTPAREVDLAQHQIRTDGDTVEFDKLLIATGAHPRPLRVPGSNLPGVHLLRSLTDARAIRDDLTNSERAVVVGAGFIGMETASVLAQKQVEVTMVFPEGRVWEKCFTPEMSHFFEQYYKARGVRLRPGTRVASLAGTEGRVTKVLLDSREEVPADLVIAGLGVEPATELFAHGQLKLRDGILVNEFLETSHPDVYAAGDVARYYDMIYSTQRRFEHWDNAVEQARHAARAMAGQRKPFIHVPYFFSDEFDLSWELWGDPAGADLVLYRGDVTSDSFSVWWLAEGRLVAAFALNRPDEERELARTWIYRRMQVEPRVLQDESRALSSVEM